MAGVGFFLTQDFDLAAALITAGVELIDEAGRPIEQVFSDGAPASVGGKRGIQMASASVDGLDTEALRKAYDDSEADKALDLAIQQLPIDADKKAELLRLAQLSAMSYIAHAQRNREALEKVAGQTSPLVEIARGPRVAIVPAHGRSDELNRKLLAKFG